MQLTSTENNTSYWQMYRHIDNLKNVIDGLKCSLDGVKRFKCLNDCKKYFEDLG